METNPRLDALHKQFEDAKEVIATINTRASAENRSDLNDTEQTEYDAALARANELKVSIEKEEAADKLFASVTTRAAVAKETVAEVANGSDVPEKVFQLIRSGGTLDRATQTTATAGAGSKPYIVTSDLFRFVDAKRRVIESFGHKTTMPNAVNWNVLVETGAASVGVHAEGVADIPDSIPSLALVNIPAVTYAGKVKVSIESLSLLDPSSEALWTRSMVEQYAIKTDQAAALAIKAAATNTLSLSSGSTAAQVEAAVNQAAYTVLVNSTREANVIIVNPSVALYLKNLRYIDGTPAFPIYGPTNRNGVGDGAGIYSDVMHIQGLPVVVCNGYVGGTFMVGNTDLAYFYEGDLPSISAYNTDDYTKTTVIAGRVGFYIRPEGFVKITDNSATPVYS